MSAGATKWPGLTFWAYRDAEGRYADFHALRHSFITMVGKAGVSPREHQDLARHSTYALTSRYSHSRFYDLAAAVQSLPIPASPSTREALAATGTDGSQFSLGPNLGPQAEILSILGETTGDGNGEGQRRENHGNHAANRTNPVVFQDTGDSYKEYPQGDSNPCLSRERAMS